MTLGDLMQAAAAFWQVHAALNWLADNALSLANWSASARRVAALDLAYQELDVQASQCGHEAFAAMESKSRGEMCIRDRRDSDLHWFDP